MTLITLRDLLKRQPFEPFRVILSSGDRYEVRHPEMAWLTRTSLMEGLNQTKEGVPGTYRICSLLHVAAVEPISVSESA